MKKITIEQTSLDLDDTFQTHSTRAAGGGFLNWKEDGQTKVWFHPKADVRSLWGHSWFGINEEEDKDGSKLYSIGQRRFNCFERESILLKQRFRDRRTGEREYPPVMCPMDFMLEWVHKMVRDGDLDQFEPVFRFEAVEGADDDDAVTLYAGGMVGMFQSKDLTKAEEKEILKKTGIPVSKAYMQNLWARQTYLFRVVAHETEDAGCVISQESVSLGNCIKQQFAARKGALGDEKGNYKLHPFCMQWFFDDKKSFSDKYDAKMLQDEMPEHVKRAFAEPPPDIERVTAPYSLYKFRQEIEQFSLIEMPVAEFFAAIEEHYGVDSTVDDSEQEAEEEEEEKPAKPSRATSTASSTSKKPAAKPAAKSAPEPVEEEEAEEEEAEPATDEEAIECLACGQPLDDDNYESCPHCGAKYEVRGDGDDAELVLTSRPCANPDCMERVVVVDDDNTGICPQCGAEHDEEWNFTLPVPVEKPKTKPSLRAKTVANKTAAKAPEPAPARKAKESPRAVARKRA